jgi:aminobenzoyl-glutamate utilization protein B
MSKSQVFDAVESEAGRLIGLAEDIWANPELGLQEDYASSLLIEVLSEAGFQIQSGVGGMPTAFVATYGTGDPTIGILGEYDALPDLSQSVSTHRDPVEPGGAGHGCGHNLFGAAGVGAALGLKAAIDRGAMDGTIRFYGTPAEETLVGKVYMARAGVFDDLDAALTWHPSDVTGPQRTSSLAVDSVMYSFSGTPAHAAQSPVTGRSALDAVQLMNTGVEYLREHMPDRARIHYTIQEGGGAPNVIPSEASAWYFVRAPTRPGVERLADRVEAIAEGAAMMTDTTVEREYVTGSWELLSNDTIGDLMYDNLQAAGPVGYSEADREFATALQETIDPATIEERFDALPKGVETALTGESLVATPFERTDRAALMMGSTDVGDVSWIAPTAQFRAASWAVGTRAHTWQAVAASGGFGTKTVPYVAKALAGTAYDLVTDRDSLAAATAEFEERTGDRTYETPLPEDAEPPVGVSLT